MFARLAIAGFLVSVVVVTTATAHANMAPRPPQPSTKALDDAQTYITAGKLDDAEKRLEAAPDKKAPRYFLLRAEIFRLRNNFARAELEIKNALDVKADMSEARAERGALLLEMGRVEEAAAELRRAVAEQPDLSDAWYNLGTAELKQHHCKKAVAALTTATDRAPKDAATWLTRSEAELCVDATAATASARRATELGPKEAAGFVALGAALRKAKKLDDAQVAYTRATVLDGKSVTAWWSLGLVEIDREHYKEAIAPLEKAVALDGSAPRLVDLGRALGASGKRAEAATQFERALAKDPKYVAARILYAQELVAQKRCAEATKTLAPLDGDAKHQPIADKLRAACKK